jgi:hypothetical protein
MAPVIGYQGRTLRTPRQQADLAVRILDGRHRDDVIESMVRRLGRSRSNAIGIPDMSRNTLSSYAGRLAVAFGHPPPLVTGLSAEYAALLGDASAFVTVEKYALVKGRPLPTDVAQALGLAQRYWIGASWAGAYIRWVERHQRLAVEAVPPSQLDVRYLSHDPLEPTIVRRIAYRHPQNGAGMALVETWDEWDLTDMEAPIYRVRGAQIDNGSGSMEYAPAPPLDIKELKGDAYPWRYDSGIPFCPIVIGGDPSRPHVTDGAIEGTLWVCVKWSIFSAAMADAGFPQRNVNGLRLVGQDSSTATGNEGIAVGPETVLRWENTDPDRPGSFHQWAPGFDPEVVGRAAREYEAGVLQMLGLPTSMEQTGGAPTDLEAERLEYMVRQQYPMARRVAVEVLRRGAAILRSMSEAGDGPPGQPPSEQGYGVLFGEEVAQALAAVAPAVETQREEGDTHGPAGDSPADTGGDRGGRSPAQSRAAPTG